MTQKPPEVRRTALEWARDIARAYRWALKSAAPEKCAELDQQAIAVGQRWIAPMELPTAAAEYGMDAVLSARQIEEFWGFPAHSIWSWASKGLLENLGEPGKPRFRVRDVYEVEGRRRKRS